ncbi:LOW QUALITY PROTEIN: hypothetical protein U9M48_020804 [Paspalum notatum var. saurae]|uniref:Uncharacterized protein n=1 Tax=Paspalum notatum var. saurae TaxID=547442 RepID=A0AAQ3THR5_PASNO
MLEMLDMGVTVRSSMTVNVTRARTNPLLPCCSCAARHAGQWQAPPIPRGGSAARLFSDDDRRALPAPAAGPGGAGTGWTRDGKPPAAATSAGCAGAGLSKASRVAGLCMYSASIRCTLPLASAASAPSLSLPSSFTTAPTGIARRPRRKSTTSLPASARTTTWASLATSSLIVGVADGGAGVAAALPMFDSIVKEIIRCTVHHARKGNQRRQR